MRALEQLIIESGEASIANASLVEMQQVYNLHIPSLREHDFGPFQLRYYVLFLFSESNEFNDPVQWEELWTRGEDLFFYWKYRLVYYKSQIKGFLKVTICLTWFYLWHRSNQQIIVFFKNNYRRRLVASFFHSVLLAYYHSSFITVLRKIASYHTFPKNVVHWEQRTTWKGEPSRATFQSSI